MNLPPFIGRSSLPVMCACCGRNYDVANATTPCQCGATLSLFTSYEEAVEFAGADGHVSNVADHAWLVAVCTCEPDLEIQMKYMLAQATKLELADLRKRQDEVELALTEMISISPPSGELLRYRIQLLREIWQLLHEVLKRTLGQNDVPMPKTIRGLGEVLNAHGVLPEIAINILCDLHRFAESHFDSIDEEHVSHYVHLASMILRYVDIDIVRETVKGYVSEHINDAGGEYAPG